jgi:hypothetical protein
LFFLNIFFFVGSARVTYDFKAKESIPIGFNQLSSSYYHHQEIPFFIVVAEFWFKEEIIKRIFVVVSPHNKQDVHYVLDSLNFILSLQIFDSIDTIYMVSDNATNLKNGFDFFNLFSPNGPLSGVNRRKRFKYIRIFFWFDFHCRGEG